MSKNYKLLVCDTNYDYEGSERKEIAKLFSYATLSDVMYIYYDKFDYKESGYNIRVELNSLELEDGEIKDFPVVIIGDIYRECFKKSPKVFEALMMHEYGHFINGDLYSNIEREQMKDIRVKAVLEGKVYDMELKADIFAVSEIGKSAMINSLDFLIKQRRERSDSAMDLAIKEFELRKNAVKRMR